MCIISVYRLLLEHFKKFPVSATGGIVLAKYARPAVKSSESNDLTPRDLKSYQEAAERFNIPIVDERFDFLRLLGNLFMLPHEALKQYTEDNALSRVDFALLKPYLMQRSDWGTFTIHGIDSGDSAVRDRTSGEGGEGSTGKLMERFGGGRLGAMMKDLESLRLGTDDLKGISLPSMPSMPVISSMSARPFGLGATSPA